MGMIRSVENLFGGHTFYNETGEMIGSSVENLFGGETFYDAHGTMTGTSVENLFGGETIYTYDQESYDPAPRRESKSWLDDLNFDHIHDIDWDG